MSLLFTLPQEDFPTTAAVDPAELGGEDISLVGGSLGETPAGDWSTVRAIDAARQSVLREAPMSPGEFVRRPEMGGGLSGLLFKGATASTRDQAVSRMKTRLRANPRIKKTIEVSGSLPESGLRMTIRAESVDGLLSIIDQVFKP